MLAAQVPGTAWQNFQASPMYPGSTPASQVPGGQVPSWDPTMQAARPSYVSGPGAFPSQTYGAPPVPPYAATAMPAASSPLAHNANSLGISQPSGASPPTPGPGSSPLMQSSPSAQGLGQPSIRPAGASPASQQPYYG